MREVAVRAWLGHLSGPFLIACMPALVLVQWLAPGSAQAPLGTAWMVGVLLAWWALRRHDRSLCELCVCAMPDCPSADAERYHRRLHAAHLVSSRLGAAWYLSAVVFSCLALGDRFLPLIAATISYLFLAQRTHRRLQPWCPECAGGGGSGVDVTGPAPKLTPAA